MKLFYWTGNQSKLRNMRAILAGMPIELVTPADLGIQLPAVEENGATPLENAALKAAAYHAVSGLPSFSLDSGLYLEGVPAELQPVLPTAQSWKPGIKSLHLLGERCFIFTLHHLQHCAVQAHAGVLCAGLLLFFLYFLAAGPQTHKVVVCKAEHRPQHGGSKIDILRRVVDDL